jgi:hypothetical protein
MSMWKKLLVTAVATGLATGSLALAQDGEKKPEETAPKADKKDGCGGPDGCGGKKDGCKGKGHPKKAKHGAGKDKKAKEHKEDKAAGGADAGAPASNP